MRPRLLKLQYYTTDTDPASLKYEFVNLEQIVFHNSTVYMKYIEINDIRIKRGRCFRK